MSDQPPPSATLDAYLALCKQAFRRGESRPEMPIELASALDVDSRARLERAVGRLRRNVETARMDREARKKRVQGFSGVTFNSDALPRSLSFPTLVPSAVPQSPRSQDQGFPITPGFEIEEFIDEGACGSVYRARSHDHFEIKVALKVLRRKPPPGSNGVSPVPRPFLAALLIHEARLLAHIGHRHVIRYFGSGLIEAGPEAGTPFIATQFIMGGSLARRVGKQPQDPRWSARIMAQVADALQFVHQLKLRDPSGADRPDSDAGILHCDVKPSNILLGPGDEPFLTDFGIARTVGRASETEGISGGTQGYAAPEQFHQDPLLTPAVDVYGLGATLYHLLTGRPPRFDREPTEPAASTARARLVSPRQLVPRVPVDLDRVCVKCLQLEPAARYRNAGELRQDLELFLEGKPVSANPVGWFGRAVRWAVHNPGSAMLAGGLACAAIFVFGLIGTLYVKETITAETERQLRNRADELARVAQGTLYPTMSIFGEQGGVFDGISTKARKEIAERFLPAYDRLITLQEDLAETRALVAQALVSRAKLRQALGTTEDDKAAIEDCQRSENLFSSLEPTPDNLYGAALAFSTIVPIVGRQGHYEKGLEHLAPARSILQRLVAEYPDKAEYRFELAMCLNREANCHRYLGDRLDAPATQKASAREFQQAQRGYQDAIDQMQQLVKAYPDRDRYREWQSRIWGNLGYMQLGRHDIDEPLKKSTATKALLQARMIAVELDSALPYVTSIQDCLASALLNNGDFLIETNQPKQAAEEYQRAVHVYDRLTDRHPDNREFRWGQAQARSSHGRALARAGLDSEAQRALEEATRRYDDLMVRYPDVLLIASERMGAYDDLVDLRLRSAPPVSALYDIARGVKAHLDLVLANAHSGLSPKEKNETSSRELRRLAKAGWRWGLALTRLIPRESTPQ